MCMRFIIPLFSICFLQSIIVYSQNEAGYKYIYEFQIEIKKNRGKIAIDTLPNKSGINTVKGKLNNNKSEPMMGMTIILKCSDTTMVTTSDQNGNFAFTSKPSVYQLLVSGIGYDSLQMNIVLTKAYNVFCSISLAEQQSKPRYKIYSKRQLSEYQINSIRNCVRQNEPNINKCRKKHEYFITQEI